MPHFQEMTELQKAVLPVSSNTWLRLKSKTAAGVFKVWWKWLCLAVTHFHLCGIGNGNFRWPQKMTRNVTTEMEMEIVSVAERALKCIWKRRWNVACTDWIKVRDERVMLPIKVMLEMRENIFKGALEIAHVIYN